MSDQHPFEKWLTWLDSHDGRLFRRRQGYSETDDDLAATVAMPPSYRVPLTVGDLRKAVELMRLGRCWPGAPSS